MAQIAYVDWDGLYYYDSKIKQYIHSKFQDDLKIGEAVDTIDKLPDPSVDHLNYIFQITKEFTTNDQFKDSGSYPAGSWVKVSAIVDAETGLITYKYTIFSTAGLTPEANNRLLGVEYDVERLNEVKANKSDLDDYTTTETLEANYVKNEALDNYATIDSLNTKANAGTTLKDYGITDAYTKKEVDTELETKVNVNEFNDVKANIETNVSDITDQVTDAQTAIENLQDAATNLDLTKAAKEHTHSSSDIEDIDFTSYAKKADVEAALDYKADKGDVVSNATFNVYQNEVNAKFNNVNIQIVDIKEDINDLETDIRSDINKLEENIEEDLNNNYYRKSEVYSKDEVRDLLDGKSPEIPSNYITEDELELTLNSKNYLTEASANNTYVNKSALDRIVIDLEADIRHVEDVIPKDYVSTGDLNSRGYVTDSAAQGIVATAVANSESKLNTANAATYLSKASAEEIYTSKSYADNKYATPSYVEQKIAEAKLDPEDFGDVTALLSNYYKKNETYSKDEVYSKNETYDRNYLNTNFANQAWVNEQGYVKGENLNVQLQDLATKSEVNAVKTTVDNLVIPEDVSDLNNDLGFITEEALEGYSKFSGSYNDLTDKPEIPSIEGLATEEYVDTAIKKIEIPTLDGYAKTEDIPTKVSELENDSEFTTLAKVAAVGYVTEDALELKNYVQVSALDNYATKDDLVDINAKLDTIPTKISDLENDKGYITAEDIPETDLSNYYNKAEVDELIPDTSEFIKVIPDEYVTEEELEAKGYLTEHQSLEGYATTEALNEAIATVSENIPDVNDFITIDDVKAENYITEAALEGYAKTSDISGKLDIATYNEDKGTFALKAELPTVPTKTSELTNDSGYITSIPENYATKEDVANEIGKIEIPEVDISTLATKEELAVKANDILFTEEYKVTTSVGSFTTGESVKDLTIAQIITKLLGLQRVIKYSLKFFVDGVQYGDEAFYEEGETIKLPETDPIKDGYTFKGWKVGDIYLSDSFTMSNSDIEAHAEFTEATSTPAHKDSSEVVKTLIDSTTPTYVLDGSGNLVECDYSDAFYRQMTPDEAKADSNENYFYQIVDENGELIESGYSVVTIEDSEAWLTIALPASVDITTCIVKQYNPDPANPGWHKSGNVNLVLDTSYSIEGYNVYSADNIDGGATYRVVINS